MQMRWFLFLVALIWGACSAATQQDATSYDNSKILGLVNQVPISVEQFQSSYMEFLIRTGANDNLRNRFFVWNQLSEQALLAAQAESLGLLSQSYFDKIEQYEKRILAEEYLFLKMDSLSVDTLDEGESRRAYVKHKTPIVIRHLFFKNEMKAQKYYQRLARGEDFVALANELYETDTFDPAAGMIGEVKYIQIDDRVAEAAYSLAVGEYSKPVRSSGGYHIVRLEDILRPGIIAEDQYQVRHKNIDYRVIVRKKRMLGSGLTQNLMKETDVQINKANAKKVQEAVRANFQNPDIVKEQAKMSVERLNEKSDLGLEPGLPLAAYQLHGQRQIMTVKEFERWLPFLSKAEASQRIGAALGRALKYEVLAQLAIKSGLKQSFWVQDEVSRVDRAYRTQLVKGFLRKEPQSQVPDAAVEQAYQANYSNNVVQLVASYSFYPTPTLPEAKTFLSRLELESESNSLGEISRNVVIQKKHPLYRAIMDAPQEKPQIVVDANGQPGVFVLASRQIKHPNKQEVLPSIRDQLAPFADEIKLTARLIRNSKISLDTALFYSIIPKIEDFQ